MTDTLSRPARPTARTAAPSARPRGRVEVGLLAAVWASCAGVVAMAVPVLLVWAADARSGAGAAQAMRAVGQVWVVAHGASLHVPGGTFGLTPLGLVALPVALLLRASGHAARESAVTTLREALLLTGAIAAPYGVLTAIVAAVSATTDVQPIPWQALLAGALLAAAAGFFGVVRASGLRSAVLPALPERIGRLLPGCAAALGVILAGGSVLAAASLGRHLGRAGDLAAATAPGKVGGVALLVLGLTLVPNAALWGASWLAGPGFAVGVGTSVGPFGTTLGPVPSLPLLAGLPGPVPAWVGVVAVCIPLAGGALGGLLVARRLVRPTWVVAGREAALLGPAAGIVAGLVGWLSGGPVGGARLTDVGPSPWQLGLAVAVEVAVGAAAAAALAVRRTP